MLQDAPSGKSTKNLCLGAFGGPIRDFQGISRQVKNIPRASQSSLYFHKIYHIYNSITRYKAIQNQYIHRLSMFTFIYVPIYVRQHLQHQLQTFPEAQCGELCVHAADHQPMRVGAYCSAYLSAGGADALRAPRTRPLSATRSTQARSTACNATACGAFLNIVGCGRTAAAGNGRRSVCCWCRACCWRRLRVYCGDRKRPGFHEGKVAVADRKRADGDPRGFETSPGHSSGGGKSRSSATRRFECLGGGCVSCGRRRKGPPLGIASRG